MSDLQFFDEIPINVSSALHQLLGRFQSVRDGLPELIKNSKDHYSRLEINERTDRVILVLINTHRRCLGVLDFGGATRTDFRHWVTWADANANRGAGVNDIEGGHGNGGKGFMVRGSKEDSFFESCRDGLRTKMGYSATVEDRLYFPAFFSEDGKKLDNVKSAGPRKHLDTALAKLAATYDELPEQAKSMFEKRQAYSLVQLNGVRDWAGRRASAVQMMTATGGELMSHAQAALTIETCSVFVVVDGTPTPATPLVRTIPEPMPGFETEITLSVPAELKDPRMDEMIETGASEAPSSDARTGHILRLATSKQSLRMAGNKAINVVRVRNARNVIGNWSVADLCAQSSSAYIYGVLHMSTMGSEHQIGADRIALADSPLVRALEAWTAQQVADLAAKIQRAISKEHKPQEIDKANDGLRKMREAMRQFLERAAQGQGGGNGEPPQPPLPGTIVRQIVLEHGAQALALAKGTTVPLVVRAYDLAPNGDRLRVRGVQLDIVSDPPSLTSMVGRRSLRAENVGRVTIWFRDAATGVESNRVEIEIVNAVGATIQEIPARPLLQGEEVNLRVLFTTARKTKTDSLVESRADLMVDATVDEPNVGWVDRYGVFTAGGQEGTATVRVRFGPGPVDTSTGVLRVGPDRVRKRSRDVGNKGADVPHILMCGVDAPGMDHYPENERTIKASDLLPTIIDYEPLFEPNVIYINPDSKEAAQMRRNRGGRRGSASIGTETFLKFLAMKCFEILKRLYVRQILKDIPASELQFRQTFAEAEMRCAPFIDVAFGIAEQLEPE